jgi:hypothetical protein
MTESDDSAPKNAPQPPLDTSDLAEIRTGIHKGWDLPDKIRRVLPAQVLAILADKNTPVKDKLKAVEILERMVEKSWGLVTDEEGRMTINEQLQKMLDSIMPPVSGGDPQPAVGDQPSQERAVTSDEGGGLRAEG